MPVLLVPAALYALAALALPLLIHLARRTELRRTDFAALRWLRARPRPRQRPRFEEWPLLILRLLLLAMLVLWLARPVTPAPPDDAPRVYVVPGIAPGAAAPLLAKGVQGHWLAPGFPPLDTPAPDGPVPVASLVRELDAETPPGARLHILVPAIIEGADAERPRVSRPIDWRIVPGTMAAPPPSRSKPVRLAIRTDGRRGDSRYLGAVATAWRDEGERPDIAPLDAPLPDRDTVVAWLGSGALPAGLIAWVEAGGQAVIPVDVPVPTGPVVVAARDAEGRPFLEATALGRGRLFRFTRRLSPPALPALLEPDFPERLRAAIRPTPAPVRAFAADIAPQEGAAPIHRPAPLREWRDALLWAICALFLLERWLATAARRWVAP